MLRQNRPFFAWIPLTSFRGSKNGQQQLIKFELWQKSIFPRNPVRDRQLRLASDKTYSILFYSILFYSILFYSILFYSILSMVNTDSLADRPRVKFVNQKATALQKCVLQN